ncbi:DUF58 domain-containing protein [Meridianimarinicoccus aquatilis]|uniref:DUF58 domain-containing protein n=1 Tax=Meridianimarinicoccus aquatilis TaxID=2552766 RepID=A0A4R6AZ05_9RHOB|nr:DUF58 domain-containing protein [Fluviibacterium aquatile]TDL89112.1 DUF58 domain-containing protein [Fluviibacterium aquatile]
MFDRGTLRRDGEALAAPLPPLLADAEHLASTMLLGSHGRRRPGMGEEFWQYRPAMVSDEARMIDWRRSARSDTHFIREKEWQAAQTVSIWVDGAHSMDFSSAGAATKADRARLLSMAVAILLLRGGERVGLTGQEVPPRRGGVQLLRIAQGLLADRTERDDFGAPDVRGIVPKSRALFVSDFMGPLLNVEEALTEAADMGVKGALLQVLDPAEEAFPFDGRTVFESMGGGLRHETLEAGGLRKRYLERLAERKARLEELARLTGWQLMCHHTGDSAQAALLWVFGALERRR